MIFKIKIEINIIFFIILIMRYHIAVTRFDNKTWEEHNKWCLRSNMRKYNCPVKIADNIGINRKLFVIEMNNDENKIMGISIIKNYLRFDKHYKQYTVGNYNRYSYTIYSRLDSSEIKNELVDINNGKLRLLYCLEALCFSGLAHCKRGQGITIMNKPRLDSLYKHNIDKKIISLFEKHNKNIDI